MKNKLILLIILSFWLNGVFAQNLKLVNSELEKTVKVSEVEDVVTVKTYVKNTGNENLTVKVMEVGRALADDNMFITYCWGDLCVPSEPNRESEVNSLEPDASSELKIDMKTDKNIGASSVSYRVFATNTTDALEVTFKVNVTDGTASVIKNVYAAKSATLSQPYPNPASGATTINYHIPSTFKKAALKVFDMFGKEVGKYEIQNNADSINLNLRKLRTGLYFCSLEVDNKVTSTQRLLVN